MFAALLAASLLGPVPAPAQTADPVLQFIAPNGLFASGVFNSAILDNVIVDIDTIRGVALDGAFANHAGLGQINQDAGTASNQANVMLITIGAGAGDLFQSFSAYGGLVISGNTLTVEGGSRTNTIVDSFNNARGFVQINQNTGSLNQQINIGAISIGSFAGSGVLMISDSALAGQAANNTYNTDGTTQRTTLVSNSFNGFHGAAQGNLLNGDGNAVVNSMSINFSVVNLP